MIVCPFFLAGIKTEGKEKENMAEENFLIKYLRHSYVWKNLYNTSEGMKFNGYLKSIRGEITSDKYLKNGTDILSPQKHFVLTEGESSFIENT